MYKFCKTKILIILEIVFHPSALCATMFLSIAHCSPWNRGLFVCFFSRNDGPSVYVPIGNGFTEATILIYIRLCGNWLRARKVKRDEEIFWPRLVFVRFVAIVNIARAHNGLMAHLINCFFLDSASCLWYLSGEIDVETPDENVSIVKKS